MLRKQIQLSIFPVNMADKFKMAELKARAWQTWKDDYYKQLDDSCERILDHVAQVTTQNLTVDS